MEKKLKPKTTRTAQTHGYDLRHSPVMSPFAHKYVRMSHVQRRDTPPGQYYLFNSDPIGPVRRSALRVAWGIAWAIIGDRDLRLIPVGARPARAPIRDRF